jgi:NACHT domain
MAASTCQQDDPPTSQWRRFCRWLWFWQRFLWGTCLFGLALNLLASLALSRGFDPKGAPLGWLLEHPWVLVSGGFLLLAQLIVAWSGSRPTVSMVAPSLSTDQRNRAGILAALRKAYTDELDASLQGVARIALGLHERFDLTHPARLAAWHPGAPERVLPDGTTILDAYQQAGHGLLILGEPGAGKTTLLYDLAQASLKQAEADETLPLPVVLNLSSWATKRQPLQLWLVEELELRYLIPRRLGSRWVQEGRFQLLLDGLDEVAAVSRDACIEAINTYHAVHLLPLVVCSRREEYEAASRQLTLQSAVIVQPLTPAQVNTYLKEAGKKLSAVRRVVQTNPVLQDLLTTPLMLSIVSLAYLNKTTKDLPQMGTAAEQQQQIFARYLQRMLYQSGKRQTIPTMDLHHALTWLARQMQQHGQSTLYLERLQPDWLTTPRALLFYEWLAIRLPGIVTGMLSAFIIHVLFPFSNDWLVHTLIGGCIGGLLSRPLDSSQGTSQPYQSRRFLRYCTMAVLAGLFVGVGTWLLDEDIFLAIGPGIASLLFALLFLGKPLPARAAVGSPGKVPAMSRFFGKATITVKVLKLGVLAGGLFALGAWLGDALWWGSGAWLSLQVSLALEFGLYAAGWPSAWHSYLLDEALPIGLSGMLIGMLLIPQSPLIEAAEVLVWSWKHLWQSLMNRKHWRNALLLAGGSIGLIGLGEWLGDGPFQGLGMGLGYGLLIAGWYWLLMGLFQGVASDRFQESQRTRPNLGIQRSLYNGLLLGGASGVISALLAGLSLPLSNALYTGLPFLDPLSCSGQCDLFSLLSFSWDIWRDEVLYYGLPIWLRVGLPAAVAGTLLCAILLGCLAWWRHWVLRFLLWRSGAIPWRTVRMLDEAAQCILLRKVGGGYRFIHDLFRDYLATSGSTPASGTPSQLAP